MPYKNIEDKRKWDREYRKKKYHEDFEFKKRHNEACAKWHKKRKAESPWLLHYRNAKTRCDNPNFKYYKYYGGKGIQMLLTKLEIEILYKRDHANQMNDPSIDRINSSGDYHFGNCRFIENSENCRKGKSKG